MILSKLPNIQTSIFSKMSKMANSYKAINLSQGFPNFKSDPILIESVSKAMHEGFNQYAPMAGDIELREIISDKMEFLYQKRYHPDTEITITAGATQAIFTSIAATIKKDDEVIIFTPAYDCYEPSITLFGGKVISVQLQAPNYSPNWQEVEEKINSKTRMIIVNTPHNPSGKLFTKVDMEKLQEIVVKHQLLVLSDEVYEHIVFDGKKHQSAALFPKLSQRTFITASFGKTFHNTGWKIGYCIAPKIMTEEFRKIHQYNVFCVNHPIQKGLAQYLKNKDHYLSLSSFYQQKRDFFTHLIKDSRFKFTPSCGTYFQLLNFSEISNESDIDFTERITKEHGVATIPTSVFNKEKKDFKEIRICFAKKEETLEAAANILNAL